MRSLVAVVMLVLAVPVVVPESRAASFAVDDSADAPDLTPGDGVCATAGATCTVRAAVQEANALAGPDDVVVPAGTYVLTLGALAIASDLSLTGAGADQVAIDGNAASGVLTVAPGTTVLVAALTVRNGAAPIAGGIHNQGTLTVRDAAIRDNEGSAPYGLAGGIYAVGPLVVERSTISGNTAVPTFASGGGIASTGALTLRDSTVSGNVSAGAGGGVSIAGSANEFENVTIADNHAVAGGGGLRFGFSAVATVRNTVIADNTAPTGPDVAFSFGGTFTSQGYVLVEDPTGFAVSGDLTGVLTGVDPMLLPLAAYGGPTETHDLALGSPAIDAGNPAAPGSGGFACALLDQRGTTRPLGVRCDLGAVEAGPSGPTPTPAVTPTPAPAPPCAATPIAGCRTPAVAAKAFLALTDKTDDTKDQLQWRWSKGAITTKAEFGNPLTAVTGTSYQLCIYDGTPQVIVSATIPAGGTCNVANPRACWKDTRTGYQYNDVDLAANGVRQLVLKQGLAAGKASIGLKAKGTLLDDPTFAILQPVRVQLRNSDGLCWEASYAAPAQKNVAGPPAGQFRDKAD